MRKAHLAILPTSDGRRAERRVVNLAASLREPGASLAEAEVVNLSVTGFAAETDAVVEPGAQVWLKLPGLEPTNCRCVWVDGNKAGFAFANPLHQATLDMITAGARTPPPKRHFGVGGQRPAGGLRPR
ncbi:MAG TPA: PilZ domain-containing protein [Allosphingosinicella sp.]